MPRDVYERLVALRDASGHSFGKLVQQALGVLEKEYESVRKQGEQRGFDAGHAAGMTEGRTAGFLEAVRRYRVTYPCNVCGLPIILRPGSGSEKAATEALRELGWGHRRCHLRRLAGGSDASRY